MTLIETIETAVDMFLGRPSRVVARLTEAPNARLCGMCPFFAPPLGCFADIASAAECPRLNPKGDPTNDQT